MGGNDDLLGSTNWILMKVKALTIPTPKKINLSSSLRVDTIGGVLPGAIVETIKGILLPSKP